MWVILLKSFLLSLSIESNLHIPTKALRVIYLALLGVIFLLRKSDIAPDGRSDILFAFVNSNTYSVYHCRRQYHARSAYNSPQANRVGAPQVRQGRRFIFAQQMLHFHKTYTCFYHIISNEANLMLASSFFILLYSSLISFQTPRRKSRCTV